MDSKNQSFFHYKVIYIRRENLLWQYLEVSYQKNEFDEFYTESIDIGDLTLIVFEEYLNQQEDGE